MIKLAITTPNTRVRRSDDGIVRTASSIEMGVQVGYHKIILISMCEKLYLCIGESNL